MTDSLKSMTFSDPLARHQLTPIIWQFVILNLINDPRMFNGAIVDLSEKPYIQQKILLQ